MNRKEYNREQTIISIEETFMELYARTGIEKITVKELCARAGISRTILYRYFDDKYQILESIEDRLLETVREINTPCPFINSRAEEIQEKFPLLYLTARYIKENERFFKPLLGEKGDSFFVFKWKKLMRRDFREKLIQTNATQFDVDLVSEIMASSFIGGYTFWLYEKPELTCEEITDILGHVLYSKFYP